MKPRPQRLTLGAALLLAACFAVAPRGHAAEAESARDRGAKVFEHRCAMCHREGQTGTFVLARRLGPERALIEQRTDLTGPYIRVVVRAGLLNMPRISRVELPDGDLAAVVSYLTRE